MDDFKIDGRKYGFLNKPRAYVKSATSDLQVVP